MIVCARCCGWGSVGNDSVHSSLREASEVYS